MNNKAKITRFSTLFYVFLSFLLVALPFGTLLYWVCINQLPEYLLSVNMVSKPLVFPPLSGFLRFLGFTASLFPLCALLFGIYYVRKLFAQYRAGNYFSSEHVILFKKIAKALVFWVIFSICYNAAKSVLFSLGNPPGSRVLQVGLSSSDVTMLVLAGVVFFIAWIMDEGRLLSEENELTV